MEAMSRMQLQLKACPAVQRSQRKQSLSHALVRKASTSTSLMKPRNDSPSSQSIFRNSKPCQRRTNAKQFIDEVTAPAALVGNNSSTSVILSAVKVIQWPGSTKTATVNSLYSTLLSLPLDCATVIILRFAFHFRDKRLQDKHKEMLEVLDNLLPAKRTALTHIEFNILVRETEFSAEDILMLYLIHVLSTRAFDAELVADLIHLKKTSYLDDDTVHEILCDVSRGIVLRFGVPTLKLTAGFTPMEVADRAPAQAAFSKILYLAELRPFCFPETPSSWKILKIFEVTEEDAVRLQLSDPLSDHGTKALDSDSTS